jgi:hypothetical protein
MTQRSFIICAKRTGSDVIKLFQGYLRKNLRNYSQTFNVCVNDAKKFYKIGPG